MIQVIEHSTFIRGLFIVLVCILPTIPGIIYYLEPKENRTNKDRQNTIILSGVTTGISIFGLGFYFSEDFLIALVVALAAVAGMLFSMKDDFRMKREMMAAAQSSGIDNKHIKSKRKLILSYSCGIFVLVLILLSILTSINPIKVLVCLGPIFLMILFLILNKKNLRIK